MNATPAHLPQLAVLRLTGPDRVALLQGQASNDATRVGPTAAQLTSFSDPKGRCHAVAVLAARAEEHLLITEASVADALCKRLAMYILRSKVRIEVATDLAVLGQAAGSGSDWAAAEHDDALAIRVPGARELLVATMTRAAGLPDGSGPWQRDDVAAGLAWISAATAGHFVPLWLGLERFGAIDFRKGCYTGQEIVARSHYLGKVKQALHRATAPAAVAPGTTVRDASGADAGGIVTAVACDDGRHAVLAVLRSERAGQVLQADGVTLDGVVPV
jgi:folate-binding protein YgfZ